MMNNFTEYPHMSCRSLYAGVTGAHGSVATNRNNVQDLKILFKKKEKDQAV